MILPLAALLAAGAVADAPRTGMSVPATLTVKTDPATYDLAGFRLGMSEADVEGVMRSRGLKVVRATRVVNFEDQVRGLMNVRGGSERMMRHSVLGQVEFDDGKGGRVLLKLLTWPDTARVSTISFLPPRGTAPSAWQTLLADKYGRPSDGSGRIDSEGLHARWCGRASCGSGAGLFQMSAIVGLDGGSVTLGQPEGTATGIGRMIEAEADRRMPRRAPGL
ncbi:hypothetical protein [Novosphingobium rosa]|uniref:hypothetical protein n=1 Tax=Novosphingobium rosa TaxID=76978 RepID=UPI000831DADB|nr:hypothetical protein [Novosphingobium rosa]